MKWPNTIFRIFVLISKMGFLGIKYLLYRRKGQSALKKELRRMGIEKDAIRELSRNYKSIGDMRKVTSFLVNKNKRA